MQKDSVSLLEHFYLICIETYQTSECENRETKGKEIHDESQIMVSKHLRGWKLKKY